MYIRELLLLQSLFYCPSSNDILELISMQENPEIFYSAFLELERKNMITLLAFDSKAIKSLLDSKFESYFSEEFPLIYRNKKQTKALVLRSDRDKNKSKIVGKVAMSKYFSAIDIAFEHN
jgi:hypothetical protein